MKAQGKRGLCICLALLTALLSSCSRVSSGNGTVPAAPTLPPAADLFTAPVDDSGLMDQTRVNIYLPSRDGQKLLAHQETVAMRRVSGSERALVQALLDSEGDGATRSIGGLKLHGVAPVEVSGDVCTVDLASSALALEYDEMYFVGLAIASTMADVTGIRYVNVLVADQAVSYDVGDNLPAGSVAAHPGEELPILWDAMEARRTPLGGDVSKQPLSTTATLYFPLADGSGFVAEARNLTFSGQTAAILASGLLMALSAGPQVVTGCVTMPDIPSLMTLQPTVSQATEGGKIITLYFREDLQELLEAQGISYPDFIACINWTLCTFIPSVTGVRFFTGSTMLTALYGETYGMISITDGVTRRRFFAAGLRDQDEILLCRGDRLTYVGRSMPADHAGNPRTLLEIMFRGATEEETAQGLRSSLPEGMTDEDIIGIGVENGTLLVNLSGGFADAVSRLDESGQRLCCYAIVNTLCDTLHVNRVRFYWDGEVREYLGTSFYWAGEFMRNHALMDP